MLIHLFLTDMKKRQNNIEIFKINQILDSITHNRF